MLRDLGTRDEEFMTVIREVQKHLLDIADVDDKDYAVVLMQGCGSMGVEAVLGCAVPREGGRLLVVENGAYGRRMADMARVAGIPLVTVDYPENTPASVADVAKALKEHPDVTHVAVVHCETTSGLFNPIDEIGDVVAKAKREYIIDAMSSFGASTIKMKKWGIDWLVSSANKCIEGVPGFSFALIRRDALKRTKGNSRSLCLDLYAQDENMRRIGQFRFTPPVQVILAFHRALQELKAEGGVKARQDRYQENCRVLREGMAELGIREFLAPKHHGWIITSFHYPDCPNFSFDRFYDVLKADGFLIYPGKVGKADLFRVGNIGHITPADVRGLLGAMRRALEATGSAPVPRKKRKKA